MRPASPKPVTVESTQASSAWAGTCDCTYRVDLAGSMPAAMYCAAVRRVFARSSAGSFGWVSAWRSTTEKKA